MSADNGIYIAKFKDGYRVIEAGAIDNLEYYPEGSLEEKNIWRDYWANSQVYKTKEEAVKAATEQSENTYTEYGIVDLGEGVDWRD